MRNVRDMINLLAANEEIGLDVIIGAIVTVRNEADPLTFDNLNNIVVENNGINLKEPLDNHNLKDCALDVVDGIFLERYIVSNFYLPEHIGIKKEEETAFKRYLYKLACDGVFNEEMAVHVANFHKENKQ